MQKMIVLLPLFLLSCSKYLDKVSDPSLQVPNTASNLQSYLDNNVMVVNSTPGLGPLGSDDYWLTTTTWLALGVPSATAYNWQSDIFQGQPSPSWNNPYTAIYYANEVLYLISQATIDSSALPTYNALRGSALFYRAFHFYHLEETFGQPYRPATAGTDLGIPLRLSYDVSQPDKRATVQQVFQQILTDLGQAAPLLSAQVPWQYRNRPSRPAAYALLTEVCLTMQDYTDAQHYADSALDLYSGLVQYDTVDAGKPHPFSLSGNNEVLFECSAYNYPVLYTNSTTEPSAEVDTTLYASYSANDLRRSVFFKPAASGDGGVSFKGSYTGQIYLFSGLSVDLVFLSRAECRARASDISGAMSDLDTLLATRYQPGSFQPYTAATAATAEQALQLILAERRKETVFREVRWTDLRRLNQDPLYATFLYRNVGGQQDTLAPMDMRYAYPLPQNEIQLGGIPQNPR